MSLQDYRNKFPEYNDIPDDALVQGLYKKYGEAENFDHFSEKMGYVPQVTEAVEETPDDWPDDIREGAKKAGEEKILRPSAYWPDIREGAKRVARDTLRGVADVTESVGKGYAPGLALESDIATQGMDIKPAKDLSGETKVWDDLLKLSLSKGIEEIKLPDRKGVDKYLHDFAGMAPQMLTVIGGTALGGPLVGGSAIGLQIAGGTSAELERKGVPRERAMKLGLANAALQAPLEALGAGKILSVWKPQKTILKKLRKITSAAGTEWFTELSQSYPDKIIHLLGEHPDATVLEQWGRFADDFWETTKQGSYEGLLTAPWALLGVAAPGRAKPAAVTEEAPPAPEAAAQAEQDAVQMEQDIESGAIQPNQAVENLIGKQLLKTLKGEEAPVAEEKTGLENLLGKALLQSLQEVEEVTRAEPESATGVENLLGKSLLAKLKQPTPEVAKEDPADTSMQKLIGKGVLTRIKQTPPKLTPQQELGNQIAQVFDNYVKQTQAEEKGARKEPEVPVQQRQVPVPEQTAAPEIKPEKTEKPQEKPKSAVGEIATFDEYIKQKPKLDDMTLDELQKAREHAGRIKKKAPENKNIEGTITKIDDLISQREGEKEASEWIENEKKRITDRVAPKPRKVAEKAPVESGGLFAGEPAPVKSVKAKPVKQPKKSKLKSVEDVKNLRSAIKKLGRISWGKSFQGERKAVPGGIKRSIFYSKGLPWDTMEKELRDSGWLDPNENLIEAVQNKERLLEGRRTRDIAEKSYDELTEKDKKLKKEMEYEPEAPPKGEYVQMEAEDLPVGKKLTLIEGKTREGWDVYEVIEKDPFGVTLKDGTTIELKPGEKVEVRKEDLGEKKFVTDRDIIKRFVKSETRQGEGAWDASATRNYAKTFITPLVRKLKRVGWHTQADLTVGAYKRTKSNPSKDLQQLIDNGDVQRAWDKEGMPHYAITGVDRGKLLTESEIDKLVKDQEKPKLELEGETPMGPKRAALSATRRTKSAGRQEGLGLWEKAPKDFKLEGEQAGKKETKAFKKKTGKKIPLSVADEEADLQREIDKVGGLRLDAMGQEGYAPGAGEALVTILGHGFKGKETSIALKVTDTEADIRKKISEKQKEFKIDERIPLSVEYTGSLFDEETLGVLSKKAGETRLTAEQVEKDVKTIYDKWVNKPELVVLSYQTELPADFKRELAKQNIKGEIRGAVYKNKIYIIANGMRSADDALKTLVHETAGHWGLQEVLGKDYNATMRGIYKAKQAEIKKAVARHDFDLTKRSERYEAAEEWLAQQAESNPESTWVQQLIAAIRKALRRLNKNLQWSDAEIVSLLQKSREFVQKGGKKKGFKAFDPYLQVGEPADVFYSQMQNVLFQKLQGKGTPQAMKQAIQSFSNKGEFKKEELEWSGVLDWLDKQEGKVTKQQVLDYLDSNKVRIEEVVKGAPEIVVKSWREYEKYPGVYLVTFDNGEQIDVDFSLPEFEDQRNEEDIITQAKRNYEREEEDSATKFSSYTLEGGKNYRELLMTMPEKAEDFTTEEKLKEQINSAINNPLRAPLPSRNVAIERVPKEKRDYVGGLYDQLDAFWDGEYKVGREDYTGSHWDEPNVLVHVRFDERTDADGDRVLFVEEIQSDWHQEGRKKGYKTELTDKEYDRRVELIKFSKDPLRNFSIEEKAELDKLDKKHFGHVPDAPFKKTWPMLAIKRMVRYAADNGFDKIGWTSGETQADRYDLSKQVNRILYYGNTDGTYDIKAEPIGGYDAIEKNGITLKEAEDFVGKEIVEKIQNGVGLQAGKSKPTQESPGILKGLDLKVGGEGMKSFYDKMLVNEVNKFFNKKAWGKAKVGVGKIKAEVRELGYEPERQQEFYDGFQEWLESEGLSNAEITQAEREGLVQEYRKELQDDAEITKEVWTLPITEKMKSKALSEGMPQFQVKAWHGGGIFRKFSDKFMKTGTGGHVFGWGHYVSEEKGVAKYYRDLYDKENMVVLQSGQPISDRVLDTTTDRVFATAIRYFKEFNGKKKDAVDALRNRANKIGGSTKLEQAADFLSNDKALSMKTAAGQYKVKLFKGKSPDEYTFLDWEEKVPAGRLNKILDSTVIDPKKSGTYKELVRVHGEDVANEFLPALHKKERDAVGWIAEHLDDKNLTGKEFYNGLTSNLGGQEAASKFLDRAGISGIRYPVGTLSGVVPPVAKAKRRLNDILRQVFSVKGFDFPARVKNVQGGLDRVRLIDDAAKGDKKAIAAIRKHLEGTTFTVDTNPLDDLLKAKDPKNYVIFDPKNIEILEGPGYHHQFKPNILNKEYIAFSIAPMKDKKGNIDPDKFEKKTGIKFQNTEKNNPKDLYRGVKWLQTAHDIIKNHPTFTPTWEAQMKRVATTHQTSMVDKEKTKPYWEADKESKARINQAFIDGDISGEYYEDDVLQSEYGLSPEEITAYRGMADAMESKMDTLITGFMEDILDGAIGPKVLNAVKTTKTKKDLVAALNDLGFETDGVEKGIHWIHKWTNERKGYVPHKWDSDWVVKVDMSEQDDAVRELFGLDKDAKWLLPVPTKAGKFFPTRMMRLRAAEDAAWDVLKNKFGWSDERIQELDRLGVINIHQTRKLPVELFQGARPEVVKSLAATAVNKAWAKYKKSIPESELENSAGLFESVKQSIEEMYLGKGFGQHLIARQGYKGYRTDLENVFSEYLHGFNAFVAKGQAVTDFSNALKEIHPTKTPKLWSYAKEYIQDMLGESNEAAWFKKIASTYFLAADVSAATLNMTQNWTHAVPLLRAIKPKTGKITAEREIGKAMMDVSKEYLDTRRGDRAIFTGKSKWISEEEKGDMRQALEKGWLDPAFFEEVSGLPEGQIWQSYAKKMHMMMFVMFRGAESLNRTSTFIATLRRAKRSGLDRDEAVKKAADLVLEAHFPYSRGNRPLLVRKTGGIGNIGYTFMTYQIQNMVYLKHRFEDVLTAVHGGDAAAVKTSMKVAGSNLAYILAFGGLNALPFVYLAQKAIDIFDDDEDDWETMVRKHTPKTAGRAITRGIPAALLGNDMSWRVQGTDAIGIPVGFQIGEMLYKRGQAAWKLHGQGEDVDAMFHIMPDMIRNPYRAIVGFREGGTRRGVPPIKYTAGEAATKFLGFTPTREAETLKVGEVTKKKRSVRAEKLASFAERYLIAKRKRDREGIRDLKKDLRTWNRKQRKKKKEGIVIPWKDILRSAKSRKTYRSKGYAEDFPKYMQRFQKETKKSMDLE